jgi:hypothetical protein
VPSGAANIHTAQFLEFCVRYRVWRSRKDTHLHLLCAEDDAAFDALPNAIRNLGPWTGGAEGEVDRLPLAYRLMLTEQGFVVIYAHVPKLEQRHTRPSPSKHRMPPGARVADASPCITVSGTRNVRVRGSRLDQGDARQVAVACGRRLVVSGGAHSPRR